MSVPLEMPSSEMDVEALNNNASDSDNKVLTAATISKPCTYTFDRSDLSTGPTDKLDVVDNVECDDKDIGVVEKKDPIIETITLTITPTIILTIDPTAADVGDDAANIEILAVKEEGGNDEAMVSTPNDKKIDAQSNQQPPPPSTSEVVNITVKVESNADDDVVKNLDEKQVNEPLSTEIKTTDLATDSEILNEREDKNEEQQSVLEKHDVVEKVSSNVDNSCEVADKKADEKVVDEQESEEKADSSLEIIDNLDDTDKSDEKMEEDGDEFDEGLKMVTEDDDDDEVDDEDELGEPLTLEEEEVVEEVVEEMVEEAEEEEVDEPEEQSSGNAILIDDEDDEENDEIDDEDDDEDVDEEEDEDEIENEDDDIEEVIESDDDEEDEDSEPEEIRENTKINSRKAKGVDKRFGPKFKSKMKRSRNFFAQLKRRSIKWLTKKMHVMESDEMISTIPNDLTTPTVGCVSIGGGGVKNKENDYRYNNTKDDEGIELIEDKDDHHHEDDENKIIESDSKTNKKQNKNDSNLENSIIKNIILKQNDNNISSSDLTRSKSKTPPNPISETLDLTSPPPPQQNPTQPPLELKTNKEIKNDCNLVKKSAVVPEDNNNSNNNNNNNNNNNCSDKKIKNEENVKIINLSNDDIEMVEDNQAVDLSQEKQQPTQQQQQTQPIELEIVDKDSSKNEKDNEIVETNEKSVKSPNNNNTTSTSNADCDTKIEIKKEEKPYVEPKPQDQQQQSLIKSSSSSSASSEKSTEKNSNENSSKEDSGDETKKSGGRSTQSGAIKRSSSPSVNNQSLDYSNPSKKHCDETNSAAATLDQKTVSINKTTNNNGDNVMLNEMMEKSQNDTPDELKKNIDQIQEEIQSLDEMLKIKEQEWNNMLHLKKMKEEIFERLTRRKRINDIKSILSIGSMDGYNQIIASTLKQNNKLVQGGDGAQQPSIAVATLKDYTSNMNKISNNNAMPGIRTSSTKTLMQQFVNMKAGGQVKEKVYSQHGQRQILPKAPSVASSILQSAVNNQNKILNYTSTNLNQQKKQSIHQQQQQDYLNGHQTNTQSSLASAMGRQGAIKDVQSIIADYRQKHPEEVPRRGRRLRPSFSMNEMSGGEGGRDGNSRPSSADSSHSNSNLTSTPNPSSNAAASSNISFKDVLVKYAKMSPSERQRLNTGNSATLLSSLNLSNSVANKAYPEVTLHPLNTTSLNSSAMHSSEPNTNVNSSLLHGILTKNTTRPVQQYNTFSPTLARLLTAPERITPQTSALFHQNSSNSAAGGGGGGSGTNISSLTNPGVNLTKNHNEITITPVLNSNSSATGAAGAASTFLKRETGSEYSGSGNRIKTESNCNLDDEADDSADRLVIDEGDGSPADQLNMSGTGQEFHENEVPECQGCKKREAQFVCAGCGNQWYCSRECQVRAWDEHSDICTG